MPKVSVYLSDDLYQAARERGLSVSSVAQQALEVALRVDANRAWIDRARARPAERSFDTAELMSEVRQEFGA